MKKVFSLSTTLLIAFIFVYSCSTDSEDNIVSLSDITQSTSTSYSDDNNQSDTKNEESALIVRETTFNLPMSEIGLSSQELDQTVQIVSGSFHYASSGKNYMLFPGQAWWIAGRPDIGVQERTEENRVPSFTLVKENGLWKYNNSYQMPGFWGLETLKTEL